MSEVSNSRGGAEHLCDRAQRGLSMSAAAESSLQAVARAALQVARERAKQLGKIRAALVRGDQADALALMKVYVGIDEREADEGDTADPGLH